MKVKTEVILDWLEGEEGGEFEIEKEIKKEIIKTITRDIYEKIGKRLTEKVEKSILKKMDLEINKFIKRRMKNKIKITPDWDSTETSLDKIFKTKIDNALEVKVNKDGKVEGNYNSVGTRFEYLTGEVIDKKLNSLVGDMAKDINQKIKDTFTQQIKDQISEKFTNGILEKININKMLTGV